jgi:hypothetical protein
MPLGRQFSNTFHEGEGGKTSFYTNPESDPTSIKSNPEKPVSMLSSKHSRPNITEEPRPGVSYQGMFFEPHTATGSRQDPLIPKAARVDAFKTALNLHDVEKYQSRAGAELGRSYRPNATAAQKSMDLIATTAAEHTNIPTHLAKDINTNAVLYPGEKASRGGHYSPERGNIVVHEKKRYETIREPDIEIPKGEKGAPIPNKNFKSVVDRDWSTESIWQNDMGYKGTITDASGKEVPYHEDETHLQHLPEGHSMNVYPGKGKQTAKYISTPFQVESGWKQSYYGGSETYTTFHTRHERIPTEGTEVIRGAKKKKILPSTINADTLVHEIGHAIDPHIRSPFENMSSGADAVQEATADGYRDRFGSTEVYEHKLAPSPERAEDMKSSGYTVSSKKWGNNTDRALYAAVRQHVSMGDKNIHDITSRQEVFEKAGGKTRATSMHTTVDQKARSNNYLLGHLYNTHSHVREILGHLGMQEVGEKAASNYRHSISDAGTNHTWEQEHLFDD